MNNVIYSAYQTRTGEDGKPRAQFHPLEPGRSVAVAGLSVTPLPANHTAPAVGFVVSNGARSLYYTGDTAPGFSAPLAESPPDILISEVTYSNAGAADAERNGHMTPALLCGEIERIVAESGWTPRVLVVHRNPAHDQQIAHEIEAVRAETGWNIALGMADMTMTV